VVEPTTTTRLIPAACIGRASLAIVAAGEEGPFGCFTSHRNLGVDPFHLSGVVAAFDRAEVDQGVLLFGLIREACWAPLLAAQPHLNVVIGALGNRWLQALATQN